MYSSVKTKLVLCITLLLVLAGCDNKTSNQTTVPTVTIEHEQGKSVVPLNPQNVAVFNIATLDIMDALHIPVKAVPQSSVHLPTFLAQYGSNEYTNVGTLFEPNYEVLSSIKPDLILAGGRSHDAYKKLNEIAPTISLEVDHNDFLNSLTERVNQLGTIFNKQDDAQKLITEFKQKIEQTRAKTANEGTALVIMINGGKMSAYGPKSRFGFIFDQLGFKPAAVFTEAGPHGNAVTAEFILSVNPDWLFVLDRDTAIGRTEAESAQQVLNNTLIQKTNAWQHNHIVYLDSTSMYIAGGIQTYSQLMDQINTLLAQPTP
ncbi:siderophore ABC transporter substrate-binding protein [Orbaceae bacterium ESL0727]|nr:siderophore ABC transporter substrate-binding protein [Orbaceae bacterium ESL0727]